MSFSDIHEDLTEPWSLPSRLLEGLSEGDLEKMLRFANAAAYLVTTRKGAIRSMPEREQVEALLERM